MTLESAKMTGGSYNVLGSRHYIGTARKVNTEERKTGLHVPDSDVKIHMQRIFRLSEPHFSGFAFRTQLETDERNRGSRSGRQGDGGPLLSL